MNMLKLTAAAALAALSLSASAMSSIADEDLSAVAGQDGVSIAANLNINIGSFTWGNTLDAAGKGASISFDDIHISGLVAMTIDVISGTQFNGLYQGFTGGTGATGTGTLAGLGNIGTATVAGVTAATAAYTTLVTSGTATAAQLQAAGAAVVGATIAASASADATGSFYNTTSDVVQFAFPNVKVASSADLMNISVAAIKLGTNGVSAAGDKSFGSFAITGLDLRGTSVWMWAH